jgi:hypothetical protein
VLEVHLFDFNREIYGDDMELRLSQVHSAGSEVCESGRVTAQIKKDEEPARGFTDEFFQQLTSEKFSFRYIRGVPKEEWKLNFSDVSC